MFVKNVQSARVLAHTLAVQTNVAFCVRVGFVDLAIMLVLATQVKTLRQMSWRALHGIRTIFSDHLQDVQGEADRAI